jgi:hypothetical protein
MATHSKLTIDDDEPAYEERDRSTQKKKIKNTDNAERI